MSLQPQNSTPIQTSEVIGQRLNEINNQNGTLSSPGYNAQNASMVSNINERSVFRGTGAGQVSDRLGLGEKANLISFGKKAVPPPPVIIKRKKDKPVRAPAPISGEVVERLEVVNV